MTRVYVPATLELLAAYTAAGRLPVVDDAVLADGDDEESEYAALMTAAEGSQHLLGGPGRRVVLVAEVDTPSDADAEIAWRRVVAVHADPHDRPADADPDDDLGWYAVQEVPDLLA